MDISYYLILLHCGIAGCQWQESLWRYGKSRSNRDDFVMDGGLETLSTRQGGNWSGQRMRQKLRDRKLDQHGAWIGLCE